MSRRRFVAGNWKLHRAPVEAAALAGELRAILGACTAPELVVFPSALAVPAVVEALRPTTIGVGVQDVAPEHEGPFTGQTSALHARAAGCGWALVGHSEVRSHLGASDDRVGDSARAALRAGLIPVVCIGETLAERDAGRLDATLHRQLHGALGSLHPDEAATCLLAYEPVWAIGTGRTATPQQAADAHARIRAWLSARFPPFVAAQARILYGGSVKPDNANALFASDDVDGLLVGGASLDVDAFTAIVRAAAA